MEKQIQTDKQEQAKSSRKNCRYFLKGKCTLGDKCKNYHPLKEEKLIDPSEFKLNLIKPEDFKIDKEEMQRFNIKLELLFEISDEKDELIMIRHGLSYYNHASSEFFNQTGYSFTDEKSKDAYQTNPQLIDSDLHPYGILMSEQNSKNLHGVNIVTVFVSPLARALSTTYHLFKNHPNFSTIKFIVLPELTEILSKVQDISDIRKQIRNYGKIFDFSLMEEKYGKNLDTWQLQNIKNEQERNSLLEIYENQLNNENDHKLSIQEIILQMMDQKFPQSIEQSIDIYERSNQAKKFIQQYIIENKIDTLTQKIAIVTHNAFITNFTATGVTKGGVVKRGKQMENCQMMSMKLF